MNDIKAEKLRKRTFVDLILNIAICGEELIFAVSCFMEYFKGKETEYLINGIYALALFAVLLLLSTILIGIRKNGKPFTKSVIIKLRCMAVITMLSGIIPSVSTFENGENSAFMSVNFDSQNAVIIALGIIIGIISEIFVYGYELQQDNDLIA